MSHENIDAVILKTHTEAENAVQELQRSGFDMKNISIVGKDTQTKGHTIGYYNAGDGINYWGKQGAFWGEMWDRLTGSAFFLIPEIGPLAAGGPLVAAIVAGLQGTFIVRGLSSLSAGFNCLGIPRDRIQIYEDAIKSEMLVLVLQGSKNELAKAIEITNEMSLEVRVPSVSI